MSERVLGVLTAIHGRHGLAKAMLGRIPSRLRGRRVVVVAALGGEDYRAIMPQGEEADAFPVIVPLITENKPLTRKWQTGLNFMREFCGDFLDAVAIMGSDDFASPAYWNAAVDRLDAGARDPFGVRDCWMLNAATGEAGHFYMGDPARPVGAGRFYPVEALGRLDWTLWTVDQDKGLDGASELRLAEAGVALRAVELPGIVVDVKTGENINTWDRFTTWCGTPFARFDEILDRAAADAMLEQHGLGYLSDVRAQIGGAA